MQCSFVCGAAGWPPRFVATVAFHKPGSTFSEPAHPEAANASANSIVNDSASLFVIEESPDMARATQCPQSIGKREARMHRNSPTELVPCALDDLMLRDQLCV